jgi:hypothetical protein
VLETGRVTAALTSADRGVVGWWTEDADTGGAGSGPIDPPIVCASVAERGGRFGDAVLLDQGVHGVDPTFGFPVILPGSADLSAAVTPSGAVTLAWTGADADGLLARVATFAAAGARPVQHTLGRGAMGALASDGRGSAAALWEAGDDVYASIDGTAPELVATGEPVRDHIAATFDPKTGRIIAAWQTAPNPNAATYQTRYSIRRGQPSPAPTPARANASIVRAAATSRAGGADQPLGASCSAPIASGPTSVAR